MSASAPLKRASRRQNRGQAQTSSRDASEEDLSDTSDAPSIPEPDVRARGNMPPPPLPLGGKGRGAARVKELGEESEGGMDSPTSVYDGDIESSSTVGGGTPVHPSHHQLPSHHQNHPQGSPSASSGDLAEAETETVAPSTSSARAPTPKATLQPSVSANHPVDVIIPDSGSSSLPLGGEGVPSGDGPAKMLTRPVELTEDNIKQFVRRAVEGRGEEDGVKRWWKTNEPAEGRPVRIYADGVYDLFHFGHALQLRQAKLSFPNVHLLVGVVSDDLCKAHKSGPAMTHAERCESVRHCRWADEVLPDAPWLVDQDWVDRWQIDYVAHDEEVYPSKGIEDVYAFAKESGKFLPTRRTPSISTSDLLERIVRGYRGGFFDSKLEKNGHPELMAADVDWDSSGSVDKVALRKKKAVHRPA